MAVLVSFLVLILGFSLSELSRRQLRLAVNRVLSEKAQGAADAGLAVGIVALAADPTYTGISSAVPLSEGPETYQVTVYRAGSSTPDGQFVPTGCVYLYSTGAIKGSGSKTSAALVKLGTSSSGMKGLKGVLATTVQMKNGSSVDSYAGKGLPRALQNGSVATNANAAGSIQIVGGSRIYGTVSVGPAGTVDKESASTPTQGSSQAVWHDWGTAYTTGTVMTDKIATPSATMPSKSGTTDVKLSSKNDALAPGVYRDLSISNGGQIVLKPGVYVFRNVSLQGGAKITLASPDSPVQFYVENSFDLSNGVSLSSPMVASSGFQLYMADGSTYEQSGGTNLTGIVYAPNSKVSLSNGMDIYGAVVGGAVTLQGSASVHYDETLSSYTLPVSGSSGSGGTGTQTILFRQRG